MTTSVIFFEKRVKRDITYEMDSTIQSKIKDEMKKKWSSERLVHLPLFSREWIQLNHKINDKLWNLFKGESNRQRTCKQNKIIPNVDITLALQDLKNNEKIVIYKCDNSNLSVIMNKDE
eukprot:XP_014780929.1 PREDICTED: uncharacterized protein LOC106876755 [Octopus bimaculoides]